MNVSDLLRPLVDNAPSPPPLEHLVRRARHRRRVRVVTRAALIAVVAAAVVGIGLTHRSDHRTTNVVTASEPAVTPSTTRLPAVAPPSRIAFTRARPTFGPGLATAEIILVNADGTGEAQLTDTAKDGRVASQPAWSPDRRRLAFVESTPVGAINAGTGSIVIINADGTNPISVTTSGADTHPEWAPDGHHLAFARFNNGLPDIFVIGDDGSGLTRLTRGGAMSPTWSPDGTALAYRNLPGGAVDGGHVFIVNADGTHARQLTNGAEEGSPAWAPDGSRIAFANTQDNSIYTIRPDGTLPTRITTCALPSCTENTGPEWSPDSSQIVFDHSDGNHRQSYIVNSTGGDAHPLVTDTTDDCCTAWS